MSLRFLHRVSGQPSRGILAGGCIVRRRRLGPRFADCGPALSCAPGCKCYDTPGGAGDAAELVAEARELLDRVEDEVRRLAGEVFTLRTTGRVAGLLVFGPIGLLLDDPTGLEMRAKSYEGVIGQLEKFVTDVFNRVEKKALAGDVKAAQRLVDSTRRILGAAVSATPAEDLRADVKATIDEAIADLKVAIGGLTMLAGAALALSVVNAVRGR